MKLQLRICGYRKEPPEDPATCELVEQGGLIGREGGDDVALVLPDPTAVVSRRHARIEYRQGNYYLLDISRNGVFVKETGDRLELGTEHLIADGDRFSIGDYEIEANLVADDQAFRLSGREDVPQEPEPLDSLVGGGELGDETPAPEWWSTTGEQGSDMGQAGGNAGVADRPVSIDRIHMPPPGFMDEGPVGGDRERRGSSGARGVPTDYVPGFGLPEQPDEREESFQEEREDSAIAAESPGPHRDDTQRRSPGPSGDVEEASAVRAFLRGLGAPDLEVHPDEAVELMSRAGAMLRAALTGVVEELRQRDRFKYEHYIRGTLVDNNPLKFSPTVDDAIERLLKPRGDSYDLPAAVAVRQAYDDILAHLVAIMSVTQSAMVGAGSLARLDPEQLERDWYRDISGIEHLLPLTRKARLWDFFLHRYRQIAREAEDAFEREFQQRFARVYADEINRVRAAIREAGERKHEAPPG